MGEVRNTCTHFATVSTNLEILKSRSLLQHFVRMVVYTGVEYSSTSGNILLGVSASLFKVLQDLLHASMMRLLEFRGVAFFSGFTKRASIRGFSSKKLTTVSFQAFRNQNKRFAVMTAYDYPSARHCSHAEIDMVLVGDSLGMVSFLPFSLAAKLSLSSLVFQIGHAWIRKHVCRYYG